MDLVVRISCISTFFDTENILSTLVSIMMIMNSLNYWRRELIQTILVMIIATHLIL